MHVKLLALKSLQETLQAVLCSKTKQYLNHFQSNLLILVGKRKALKKLAKVC
jgi:hypothetical protein